MADRTQPSKRTGYNPKGLGFPLFLCTNFERTKTVLYIKLYIFRLVPKMPKKEEPLYQPIMNALKEVFDHFGDCYLEITEKKRFSEGLKRQFSKDTLYINKVEGFFPDLTGFIKTQYTTDLITVEVKAQSITIKNIFQAKEQAEIFDAKYALLVSPKVIPEEKRRFVKDRSAILDYWYNRRLIVTQFDARFGHFEIDKELYYGSLPEPFKTAYKPIMYLFNPEASKENIIGKRVIVKGKKAYLVVPEWVDDLVRKGQISYSNIETAERFYEDWLRLRFMMFQRPPTKEELDL